MMPLIIRLHVLGTTVEDWNQMRICRMRCSKYVRIRMKYVFLLLGRVMGVLALQFEALLKVCSSRSARKGQTKTT